MKIRIASSIALAGAVALGATGCNMIAPQATLYQYAPSDGVDVDVEGVLVRNLILVGEEGADSFNPVFTAVNNGDSPQRLTITFEGQGSQRSTASFQVAPGSTLFGDPTGDEGVELVELPNVIPGSSVRAVLETGTDGVDYDVPVLDGTLEEYRDFVVDASALREAEEAAEQQPAESEQRTGADDPASVDQETAAEEGATE